MRNILRTEGVVVQKRDARLRRAPGMVLRECPRLSLCLVRNHSIRSHRILQHRMFGDGIESHQANILDALQEGIPLLAHRYRVSEKLGEGILKDRKLLIVIEGFATLRERKYFVRQMRADENIVVAGNHGEFAALHNSERFEQSAYGAKVARVGVAGKIAGDNDMVGRHST